jgi:ubiquinone/menaquinone biosynthesis C-methylase UbiE/uncharacterized protein YbaR (Trm112 family)
MKLRTLDFVNCPIHKEQLKLIVWEEKRNSLDASALERMNRLNLDPELFLCEVITGALLNEREKIYYPIIYGIPRLLTYNCDIFEKFKDKYSEKISADLKDYSLPNLRPPKGEETVIRSFSQEWIDYDWDPNKYWKINADLMHHSMHYMLDFDNKSVKDKIVLEVGIGIGGIANRISIEDECELVGVDLGYAVDAAYKNFGSNPFFYIVQASAFALPFKDESFDYTYSQGVLHHSSDPRKCFANVSKTVKKKGFFYVWLYNFKSEKRNVLRKILMITENISRPLIWPLPVRVQNIVLFPIALFYVIHQNIMVSDKKQIKYKYREALHAARDRFTPRYAFRYPEEEVLNWFSEEGFDNLYPSSKRNFPEYVLPEFYLATTVIGQKK